MKTTFSIVIPITLLSIQYFISIKWFKWMQKKDGFNNFNSKVDFNKYTIIFFAARLIVLLIITFIIILLNVVENILFGVTLFISYYTEKVLEIVKINKLSNTNLPNKKKLN